MAIPSTPGVRQASVTTNTTFGYLDFAANNPMSWNTDDGSFSNFGDPLRQLQTDLTAGGYFGASTRNEVDGKFGQRTTDAVATLQDDLIAAGVLRGEASGTFDAATANALKQLGTRGFPEGLESDTRMRLARLMDSAGIQMPSVTVTARQDPVPTQASTFDRTNPAPNAPRTQPFTLTPAQQARLSTISDPSERAMVEASYRLLAGQGLTDENKALIAQVRDPNLRALLQGEFDGSITKPRPPATLTFKQIASVEAAGRDPSLRATAVLNAFVSNGRGLDQETMNLLNQVSNPTDRGNLYAALSRNGQTAPANNPAQANTPAPANGEAPVRPTGVANVPFVRAPTPQLQPFYDLLRQEIGKQDLTSYFGHPPTSTDFAWAMSLMAGNMSSAANTKGDILRVAGQQMGFVNGMSEQQIDGFLNDACGQLQRMAGR